MAQKETVTLKLPSGENVDFVVPSGMSDAEVKTYVLSKRPDLFTQKGLSETNPPDAVAQARQQMASSVKPIAPTPFGIAPGTPEQEAAVRRAMPQVSQRAADIRSAVLAGGGAMLGSKLGTLAGGLPSFMRTIATTEGAGAGAGIGTLLGGNPGEALPTAAGTAIGNLVLSPVAKFIQNLGGKVKAGPLFQAVSEAAGENTVETSGMLQAAQEAQRLKQAGFGQMPMVITRFLARMKAGTPLTFDDARLIEQAAGGKLTQAETANMRPQMYAKLAQFADQARKATMQAAGQTPQYPRWGGPGTADTFSDALQQYHAGAQAQDKLEFVKETMMELIKGAAKGVPYGAGATAGGGAVYGIYKALTGDKK